MQSRRPVGQRFSTVLVANRGEIAMRVLRAVNAAGLSSVAVHSDADRDAPHVGAADIAVPVGPAAASESYLSIPNLLEAARTTGADAVHPGYGFLSESSAFAQAVVDAGMVFIGPPADVLDSMGRKDRAREIAVSAGVPVVPAAHPSKGPQSSVAGVIPHWDPAAAELEEIGHQVGFPLMVKAAAGGGGKGMRIVREPASLRDALLAARREAKAAFGDDTMLFERYVEHGRHIEVQILADQHGSVVHLHERDCSVQRRHQKVLEEAPAVAISDAVRQLVLSSAVALGKEVGYVNAGTVEFLVKGEEAFFLEMNTRLQVEHPVTELVTGKDLVALQLAVAQGDRLPFTQEQIGIRGHAIEARIYAEDSRHGFLPQAGTAELVQWPEGVRVDAALQSGQEVTTHYDPMLGKVIAWGATREAARHRLVKALDHTAILGLTSNVGFLRELADSDAFRDSDIDTAWLDSQLPQADEPPLPDEAWCMAAWATAESLAAGGDGPFAAADGWRTAGPPAPVLLPLRQQPTSPSGTDEDGLVRVDLKAGLVTRGGVRHDVRKLVGEPPEADGDEAVTSANVLHLEIDGFRRRGVVLSGWHGSVVVAYRGQNYAFQLGDDLAGHGAAVGDGSVLAPMPGTVLSVDVQAGDEVQAGDTLAVMEAMKMELALKAPSSGVVIEVNTQVGAQVDLGATLFRVSPKQA